MERNGVTGGRIVMTPFPAGFKLKEAADEDDVLEDEQQNEYQSLSGSVMYAAVHTRPDASFGLGDQHPQTSHAQRTTHEAAGPTGSHGSAAAAGAGYHQSLHAARLHLDQHHRRRHLHHRCRCHCLHHLHRRPLSSHSRYHPHLHRHPLRLLHLLHRLPRRPLHHPCSPCPCCCGVSH
ncbi:unnamed protein product [Closterium sp. NIES-54]